MPSRTAAANPKHKSREWRRSVLLKARMRTAAGWSDACILNISSRGLLIHASRASDRGSVVEVRQGEHVIRARVMWSDGARAGLRADELLPVESILSLDDSTAFRLTAPRREVERRLRPRTHEQSRIRGRLFEFATFAVIAICVGAIAFSLVGEALARPLAQVRSALGGG